MKAQLDEHLNEIESICNEEESLRKAIMKRKLREVIDYLQTVTQRSDLGTSLEILFHTILNIVSGQEKELSLKSFQLTYWRAFNVPDEGTGPKYPHSWASQIAAGLACL